MGDSARPPVYSNTARQSLANHDALQRLAPLQKALHAAVLSGAVALFVAGTALGLYTIYLVVLTLNDPQSTPIARYLTSLITSAEPYLSGQIRGEPFSVELAPKLQESGLFIAAFVLLVMVGGLAIRTARAGSSMIRSILRAAAAGESPSTAQD